MLDQIMVTRILNAYHLMKQVSVTSISLLRANLVTKNKQKRRGAHARSASALPSTR